MKSDNPEHEGGEAEAEAIEHTSATQDSASTPSPKKSATTRSVAVSVPTLVWSTVCIALIAVAVVLGAMLVGARHEIADRDATQADQARAEQVATDYAVGAATINYQRLDEWFTALKQDTTTELANKFDATAPKLEEILTPLQWNSTATPITAKVMSESDGVFTVNVFVTVSSTNAQSPEGIQTSVTYKATISKPDGWKITDVGDSGILPPG